MVSYAFKDIRYPTILEKMPSEKAASYIHISYSNTCLFQTTLKWEYSLQKQSFLLREYPGFFKNNTKDDEK